MRCRALRSTELQCNEEFLDEQIIPIQTDYPEDQNGSKH
jgi:hypothetical protein